MKNWNGQRADLCVNTSGVILNASRSELNFGHSRRDYKSSTYAHFSSSMHHGIEHEYCSIDFIFFQLYFFAALFALCSDLL